MPEGFVIVHESEREIEVYGESPARPVFSATFPARMERALGLAKSELRLEPETEPLAFHDLLPKPRVFPASHDPDGPDFELHAMPYATALAGACPWLSLDGNLLPEAQQERQFASPADSDFCAGDHSLVLLGALARSHAGQTADISAFCSMRSAGSSRRRARSRRSIKRSQQPGPKASCLTSIRRRAEQDMDALTEITKLIPPPGWVGSLDMDRQTIQIAGEADQAARSVEDSRYIAIV